MTDGWSGWSDNHPSYPPLLVALPLWAVGFSIGIAKSIWRNHG